MNIDYIKKVSYRDLLEKYKLTDHEIGFLIDRGFLRKKDSKKLILEPIINLRNYGVELLIQHNTGLAIQCFRICYKIAPDNRIICMQQLLSKLKNNDYDAIYNVLQNLKNCSSKEEMNAYNLYLYLLSFIVECPEEYLDNTLEVPEYINLKGMDSSGSKVCSFIKNAKYKDAIKMLEQSKKRGLYSLDFEVLRILLSKVIDKDNIFKEELIDLAIEKQYDEIYFLLLKRQSIRPLNERETHILLIINAIKNLSDGICLESLRDIDLINSNYCIPENYDLTEALLRNEFKIAAVLNTCYIDRLRKDQRKNGNKELDINEDIIGMLLNELNILVRDTKAPNIQDIKFLSDFLLNKGFFIESVGLSLEDISLIKLIRAVDYYNEGFINYGDILMNQVENTYVWSKYQQEVIVFSTGAIKKLMNVAKIIREEAIIKFSKNGVLEEPKANYCLLLKK